MASESTPASTSHLPTKRILSVAHLQAFQASTTHTDLRTFIEECNDSVRNVKLSEAGDASKPVQSILSMLTAVESLALSTPPIDNSTSRFGNPAFKDFYDKLQSLLPSLHREHIVPFIKAENEVGGVDAAIQELGAYFGESWGNRTRVDYGSGMELNFVCWLLCLQKLGVVSKEDHRTLILKVFWRYIQIMRLLQSSYWLEPAGSHGVWGLDDYHFLPFLWGSAQLDGHKHLKPKAIHDQEVLDAFGDEYMYLACIKFINGIKTASLRWHSPMLDDISAVKTWSKVNSGMIKMYQAEVLGKLPVVQHFLFGTLLPYPEVEGLEGFVEEDEHGHVHLPKNEGGWTMDCCGIPVPSAFAAAAAGKGGEASTGGKDVEKGFLKPRTGLKPIPFD